jgi:hypothetical protein
MDVWKDYLKLSILLSSNYASAYNIVVAFHHHLVKNNFTLNILSALIGRKFPIDSKISNFLIPTAYFA